MELLVLFWIVCAAFTSYIASQRGSSGGLWFFLGLLFGPFALIAAFATGSNSVPRGGYRCVLCRNPINFNLKICPCGATRIVKDGNMYGPYMKGERHLLGPDPKLEATNKKCPDCAEEVKAEARKCRFCGHQFEQSTTTTN